MISIIIPTYNHLDDCLKPCIESIIKYTNMDDVELIVVANGCNDGTKKYLNSIKDEVPNLVVKWYPNALGYTKATNIGMRVATGDKLLLLNNDTVLHEQEKHAWINILLQPFLSRPNIGITGPLVGYSDPAGMNFVIFFCAMIDRKVYEQIGDLDEAFSPGGGEDTDYSIKVFRAGYQIVQVPEEKQLGGENGLMVGNFPIYHKGEATVHGLSDWNEIFDRNSFKLAERYNKGWITRRKQWELSNSCERAVIGFMDAAPPRETTRYNWAADCIEEFIVLHGRAPRVLEIGCSSGYGLKFISDNIASYTGVDYDAKIVEYAKGEFGSRYKIPVTFKVSDVEQMYKKKMLKKLEADIIIAFEVIEHLDHGKEIAQELKKHCSMLLATTPYKEPPGFWGPHHKLHRITRQDFPDFEYSFINEKGEMRSEPWEEPLPNINLMMMQWVKGKVYVPPPVEDLGSLRDKVCAYICTRGRYLTSLPLAIASVAMQTVPPDYFILVDDTPEAERIELRENAMYKYLFALLLEKKIMFEVRFTPSKGQHHGHEAVNQWCAQTGFKWAWRLDDDEVAEADVLEEYLRVIEENDTEAKPIGAVGSACRMPGQGVDIIGEEVDIDKYFGTSLEDIDMPNIQWGKGKSWLVGTQHLHSSFIYRTGVCHYNLSLSPAAHREETMFTYQFYKKGFELLVLTDVNTYHFRNPEGGIRAHQDPGMWGWDEKIFNELLKEEKIETKDRFYVVLENGIGDHEAFKAMLPELMAKQNNKQIVLAVAHPSVFEDIASVKVISIAHANMLLGDLGKYNIYGWMERVKWEHGLTEAYKEFYGIGSNLALLPSIKDGEAKPEGLPLVAKRSKPSKRPQRVRVSGGDKGRKKTV